MKKKGLKASKARDEKQTGLRFENGDRNGFPHFAKYPVNRRVGKLWQRTVARYYNSRPRR